MMLSKTRTLKDLKKNKWEPKYSETFSIMKANAIKAINDIENKEKIGIHEPCIFKMELCNNFKFKEIEKISWKGTFTEEEAYWEAPSVEIGLELFNYIRNYIIQI